MVTTRLHFEIDFASIIVNTFLKSVTSVTKNMAIS